MQQSPVEIVTMGEVILMTPPTIARLLREGLTPLHYEMLALTAHAHRLTVPELMRQALGSEARR